MFSRSKSKGAARHGSGSASSVDLVSQAAGPAQESALPTIPGSPSQPPKDAASASAASTSTGGGRAFNFLVERARGAVGARPRTASDEGRQPTAAAAAEKSSNAAFPTSSSMASIAPQASGGRFFGRGSSSAEASSSSASPAQSNQQQQESQPSTLPRSSGGFFSRKTASSNPPKAAVSSKQQPPTSLAPSPSSPVLTQKAPLSPTEGESKPKKDKDSNVARKQSLGSGESGGLLASSRKAFSRSFEDLSARRSSKYAPNSEGSASEPPPPVPTISNSHSGDGLGSASDSEATATDRKAATRRNRTTSLFPGSALNPTARSPSIGSGSTPASPTVPFPTSASVPNFRIGQYPIASKQSPDLNGDSKRDSQAVILQGFLQRKRDYHAPQSPAASVGSKSPNSFHHSPLAGGAASPSEAKMSSSAPSNSYFPSLRLRTPGSSGSKGEPDLSKNWRPHAAVLKGTKLYLHKVPSDLEKAAKAMFPTGVVFAPNSPTTERAPKSPATPSQSTLQLLKEWVPINKPNLVLSISGVEVHPYENSQRSFVFELVTEDGQRSLLQASSKEQLDLWVDNFHRAGTQIANRRATLLAQTPLAEEAEDPMLASVAEAPRAIAPLASTAPIGSGSKALFGVPLWEIVQRESSTLPKFVEAALAAVEARGLSEVGIYRISGESRVIQDLKFSLDKGADPPALFKDMDVHNLTGVFKLWLREMPELIPFSLYHDFIAADAVDGYDERLYAIRDLTWRMPQPHFDLIKRLMQHLELITDNEGVNAMHAQNLAIIFAPTLLKSGPGSFGMDMLNLGKAAKVVASLILQSAWVFGEGGEEEEAVEEVAAPEMTDSAVDEANISQPVGLGLEPGLPADGVEDEAIEVGAPETEAEPVAEAENEPDPKLEDDTVVPGKELPAIEAAAEDGEIPAKAEAAPAPVDKEEPPLPDVPSTTASTAHTSPISPGASSPGSDAFFEAATSPVLSEAASPAVASLAGKMEGLGNLDNRLSLGGPMTPMDEGVFAKFEVPATPDVGAEKKVEPTEG